MLRRITLIAALIMVTTGGLRGDTLYVPAAANAEGVNGTRWRTDLQVKAMGDAGATFTVELLETGDNNSQPAAIERALSAGQSLRLGNVVGTEFGVTGTGALRITPGEGRILVSSRTFNDDPAGTYGQTVPAVEVGRATSAGGSATLIQLSRSPDPSSGFRTNIGVVNVTGNPISVTVELFAADGTALGAVTRNLKPFEHRQINDVFHAAGADDVADGYGVVRTTSDDGRFICYASVVDNRSGDAVYVASADVLDPLAEQSRLAVFESFLRPG